MPLLNKKTLSILVVILLLVVRVSATTRDVTDQSTLTAAISASADGDIINFKEHIVITAELSITKSLTFQGNGYTITVSVPGLNDAGIVNSSPSAYRVFGINANGKTIVFQNLVIKGGSTNAGGAVYIYAGTTVKFDRCTLSSSRSSAGGGAVYNDGTCYLSYTYVTRNIASYGGGMLNTNSGTFYLEYSTIVENRTEGSNGGGGMENQGTLYVNNCSFSNNQCGGGAGALNNYGGVAYVANCSFTGNIAFSSLQGGAIYQDDLGTASNKLSLVNCLFAYNYFTPNGYTASSFTLNDIRAVRGVIDLYYCIYMANTASSGTFNYAIGNVSHPLTANGSDNDLFTGGSLTKVFDGTGVMQGTGQVFQPFLVKIGSKSVPTLKSSSYALNKGCNVRFTNGSGTPTLAYKNMTNSTWVNIVGTATSSHDISDDITNFTRASTPAIGAVERTVDNYVIVKIINASNGSVSGATIYGDVYPSGASVSMTALPNSGYAFSNWTYNLGGTGTTTSNPLTITPTTNTTLTPSFTSTTNYSITYLGNGNTGGTPPSISQHTNGVSATIASNTGNLVKTGFTFAGWNTTSYGSGTTYLEGANYTGNTNLTLYAKWTSLGNPLSVKWLSFIGKYVYKNVQLNWATSWEENNSHFEVERSENAIGFTKIGQVVAASNPSITNYYEFVDQQPLAGTSFYRLKQVDKDGKFSYSSIIQINGLQNKNYSAYVDRAAGILHVSIPQTEANLNQLFIYDGSGRIMLKQTVLPGRSLVDINKLSNGIYFIKIGSIGNNNNYSTQIIK